MQYSFPVESLLDWFEIKGRHCHFSTRVLSSLSRLMATFSMQQGRYLKTVFAIKTVGERRREGSSDEPLVCALS